MKITTDYFYSLFTLPSFIGFHKLKTKQLKHEYLQVSGDVLTERQHPRKKKVWVVKKTELQHPRKKKVWVVKKTLDFNAGDCVLFPFPTKSQRLNLFLLP